MANHHYSIEYVAPVRNSAAREFLSAVGLPVEHVLFSASEASGAAADDFSGRNLLRIGSGGDGDDAYCVDRETGEVLYTAPEDTAATFVNSSPRELSAALDVFERETDRYAGGDDPAALEELAAALGGMLEEIDPLAMANDPGFWRSILFDVAVGDYMDDES